MPKKLPLPITIRREVPEWDGDTLDTGALDLWVPALRNQERAQLEVPMDWLLAQCCPERSYTRKNLGYLEAMRRGARIIVETDDDNRPDPN